MQKITAIKGMNDILPHESHAWLWLEEIFRQWLSSYGYENMRTPIVENTHLFIRSIGVVTDIVEKEMYTFIDGLNGDSLTLRPEGTAGTLRAIAEHNLLYNATQKVWYLGPMFRHERPQKGRYRQFHQLGVEALGFTGPDVDSEIILMLHDLWQRLGLTNLELHINCLGNQEERANHRQALIEYFECHIELLDEEAKRRLYKNPLRVLDSKNPAMQGLVSQAPKLSDFLNTESLAHYNGWKNDLTALNISFVENHRLVRGLDYYNLSVFEWVSSDLGAQATVCGGGRYDPLVAELSGKENYAIGFAIGIERLLLILAALDKLPPKPSIDIFVATVGEQAQAYSFKLANQLRQSGFKVVQNLGVNSIKSQLKKANNLQAKVTLIVGENEIALQEVMVKFMLEQTQEAVKVDNLLNRLNNYLGNV
ncbi:MAG: histidine--tRNA ligase [Burkholderiales bacterium]